jgi:quinol monooxygenase YgiN
MSVPEIMSRWRGQPGQLEILKESAHAIASQARVEPGVLRCDWFAGAAKHEVVSMAVYRDAAALEAHLAAARSHFDELSRLAHGAVQWLGRPDGPAARALAAYSPAVADFDSGIGATSAAACYTRRLSAPTRQHIEIFTHFAVVPGQLAQFRRHASRCLAIVKAKDPGTSRYDWFYDEAQLVAIALDTYDDADAMFAHMRNCHAAHGELIKIATMTTAFLGELSPEAAQAIAKYDPDVLPFFAGLKPYSSGGFA